jgi:hypothetical protein
MYCHGGSVTFVFRTNQWLTHICICYCLFFTALYQLLWFYTHEWDTWDTKIVVLFCHRSELRKPREIVTVNWPQSDTSVEYLQTCCCCRHSQLSSVDKMDLEICLAKTCESETRNITCWLFCRRFTRDICLITMLVFVNWQTDKWSVKRLDIFIMYCHTKLPNLSVGYRDGYNWNWE